MTPPLPDHRPLLIAVAGPNGAGKTTFYQAHLRPLGFRFVNADLLARELALDPYPAARLAAALREELVRQRESFIFETVFSDPVGDKIAFLKKAAQEGYATTLCFIGTRSVSVSATRVAMRVMQGGHDVPDDKLKERFPRTLANLKQAMRELPRVLVFDNSDLRTPYRLSATLENGQVMDLPRPVPKWLSPLLP